MPDFGRAAFQCVIIVIGADSIGVNLKHRPGANPVGGRGFAIGIR